MGKLRTLSGTFQFSPLNTIVTLLYTTISSEMMTSTLNVFNQLEPLGMQELINLSI